MVFYRSLDQIHVLEYPPTLRFWMGQQGGILSSSRPNVLKYPPTLRFWMDRWSRDQPQPGSLFQRLREAEERDPGNEVAAILPMGVIVFVR